MVKIIYAQEYCRNSRGTSGHYFYVRTYSFKEFDFTGEWDLHNGATFSVYRSEYHHYPLSIKFWICSVSEDFDENRISIVRLNELYNLSKGDRLKVKVTFLEVKRCQVMKTRN